MPIDRNGKYMVVAEVIRHERLIVTVPPLVRGVNEYEDNPKHPPDKDIHQALAIIMEEGK